MTELILRYDGHNDISAFQNASIKHCEMKIIGEIDISESEIFKEIQSKTWSCGCRYYIIIDQDLMIVGKVFEKNVYVTNNSNETIVKFFK